MEKTAVIGMFAIIAIAGIVLLVNSTLTGMVSTYEEVYGPSYYTQPSGMQMRVESGVAVLQSDVAVNQVCRNAIFCEGQAIYTCCKHDGTSCILPTSAEEATGSCPLTHRSRCQCKEDYIAGLFERYG